MQTAKENDPSLTSFSPLSLSLSPSFTLSPPFPCTLSSVLSTYYYLTQTCRRTLCRYSYYQHQEVQLAEAYIYLSAVAAVVGAFVAVVGEDEVIDVVDYDIAACPVVAVVSVVQDG